MKKIVITLIAGLGLASSVFAGQPIADKKTVVPAEPCFAERELQLDIFGNYMHFPNERFDPDNDNDFHIPRHGEHASKDGGGGGLGLNYFFCRYAGIGIDASINSLSRGLWDFTGSLIIRYPLEVGSVCLAPYAFGGGGVQTDGTAIGIWHAGGGLEWRATPKFGVYAEGRYTWSDEDNDGHGFFHKDSAQARLGIRFVF